MEEKQSVIVPRITFCPSSRPFRLLSWKCVIMSRGSANQWLVNLVVCGGSKVIQQFPTIQHQSGFDRKGQSTQFIHTKRTTVIPVQRLKRHSRAKGWVWAVQCSLDLLQKSLSTTTEWHYTSANGARSSARSCDEKSQTLQWTQATLQEGMGRDQTAWRPEQNGWGRTKTCHTSALIRPHYECWLPNVKTCATLGTVSSTK